MFAFSRLSVEGSRFSRCQFSSSVTAVFRGTVLQLSVSASSWTLTLLLSSRLTLPPFYLIQVLVMSFPHGSALLWHWRRKDYQHVNKVNFSMHSGWLAAASITDEHCKWPWAGDICACVWAKTKCSRPFPGWLGNDSKIFDSGFIGHQLTWEQFVFPFAVEEGNRRWRKRCYISSAIKQRPTVQTK